VDAYKRDEAVRDEPGGARKALALVARKVIRPTTFIIALKDANEMNMKGP
jgi:hypothetical protein